jgi:M6 family metalloprotease-like protein
MGEVGVFRNWLIVACVAALAVPASARAAGPPPPLDPQQVQDQQTMTDSDYHPIPGIDWATNGAVPTTTKVTLAVVAFDFPDQPFVITQPKGSDPFGNPQVDPVARQDVPKFYADFYTKPEALNDYQTINGYWMEQSGGKVGITDVKTYGPYRMPKNLYQYGLDDIGQNHGDVTTGCPSQTTTTGAQSGTTIAVADASRYYVGDDVTFPAVAMRTAHHVVAVPDGTHITFADSVTVPDGTPLQDCMNTNFDRDAANLWQQNDGCGNDNCGATVHLFMYAGYDETSVWQEFGEMKFQDQDSIPRAIWGNPNPLLPNWVRSRYVPWTSWFAGEQMWGESSIRQGESSGTITHELSHHLFNVGDNNNNPYVTPYHRVGSGPWDMMDRGSFNGPGGPHNRWEVPAQDGASMGAEHTLRSKVGMGFVAPSSVLRLNRDGLAKSGLAVTDVIARAVNADPLPPGSRAGVQVFLDGASPVDHEPACDVNTQPLCDGGGPSGRWTNYSLETVQRIGYGSFEPDNGVLIAKNKAWNPGTRGTEGSQCGYNCFTWVEDAHPEDIGQVDFNRPDGTPVMRTVADYRQLNDALFHAGTDSGSANEYVDGPNDLHFYVLDRHYDAGGILHYELGIQNPAGAGPQQRGVAITGSTAGDGVCTFTVKNTGVNAPTDPALHPQDETASFDSDIYRLSASASGTGWQAYLRNDLGTAKFGDSFSVPVYVTPGSGSNTVTLKATSVSDPSVTSTATCGQTTVGGTVPATLSLSLGAPASFGAFQPGVGRDYFASTPVDVVSSAGDATLSVSDPSATAPGHLVNGAFVMPQALQARSGGAYAPVSGPPAALRTWPGPTSHDPVSVDFRQSIASGDALRTGTYAKTLTFTLSTTQP